MKKTKILLLFYLFKEMSFVNNFQKSYQETVDFALQVDHSSRFCIYSLFEPRHKKLDRDPFKKTFC